jgi:hypothetical protein
MVTVPCPAPGGASVELLGVLEPIADARPGRLFGSVALPAFHWLVSKVTPPRAR